MLVNLSRRELRALLLQAEQAHKLRDWTTGMVGYDTILSGLKEITRGSAPPDSSSSDDSDSGGHSSGYDSDSDTSGDAAAARTAKQKAKKGKDSSNKQEGSKAAAAEAKDSGSKKVKRKQDDAAATTAAKPQKRSKAADTNSADDSSSVRESDSDAAPAAAAAARAAARNAVPRVRATHVGRYAKRERAKTVRNYSATDLAAILGLPSSAPAVEGGEGADAWAAAAAIGARHARQASGSSGSDSGDDSSSSGGGGSDSDDSSDSGSKEGSEQRLRPGTPEGSDTPPSRAEQGSEQGAKALGLAAQNPGEGAGQGADSNVWWRSLFVKSGGTGSSINMKAAGKAGINAHGFLEDDQTNLYMQVGPDWVGLRARVHVGGYCA
jgi:Pin2-interacting protein X1